MNYLQKGINCDMSFQWQIKTTLRNMAFSIRTLHQIRKSLPSATRLVFFKTVILSHLEYPIFLFMGLSKAQINSLDRQVTRGVKSAFFRRKIEKSSDLKTKHQIMSFEGYLKFPCLNYFSRLLKGQIASFINSFMFLDAQLKYNTRTLKLSSQINTDSAVFRNSFVFFTRKQWK